MEERTETLYGDETLEDLQLGGLRLLQKKHNFRFGMDAVLLADFAAIHPGDAVADLGTGTGILPLLLIGRGKGKSFLGVEIQEEMAEMAARTMRLNGLSDRVEILQADVRDLRNLLPRCGFHAVVCNPPYGMPGKSVKNQDPSAPPHAIRGSIPCGILCRRPFTS